MDWLYPSFIGLNHHLAFFIKVAMVTKKPHSAEPQAAEHAAAGDALLSLSQTFRLPQRHIHPQRLLLREHTVLYHVKSTPL